ncbi:MAG: nucleoside monophosphate kinase [Candidatus Daviesbacteria bacterium]|nr:nucleoside monophosphate kinase [Candidatus Daviesbacteria bacterium]
MNDRILFIGPQGCGKSTQAVLLAEYLRIPKISTGDIFREMSQVKDILAAGQLVDDETTAEIVKKRLQESDCQNGFILDGYPRSIAQKELFDPRFSCVIYLKVPDTEVTRRMMARGREDDTLESIKTRLSLYYEQTQPLLDYYKNQGILIEVDGTGSVEAIQNEIKKSI